MNTATGDAGPGVEAAPDRRKWWVLATVMVGTFMGPLDGSVVNIALPTLTRHFSVDITTVEWVVLGYLLAISTLLLTFGRLGDILGLKPLYLTGFVIFVAGSAACAAAWSIWALVAFRVVQAIGAGMLFSVGPAIITQAFPAAERGRALGFVGISVSAGLAVGPTLGGLLIAAGGWPLVFLINLPIGIGAFVFALRVLSPDKPQAQKFDPFGAAFSFLALFPLLLALSKGEAWGWGSRPVLGLLAVAVVGGMVFVVAETRVAQPVLDLTLFRVRLFSASVVSALASYMVTASVIFLMPFYLMETRGFSVAYAGLLLTPVPAAMALLGPISGAWSDRIGSRLLSTTGLLVSAVGVVSFTGLERDTDTLGIVGRLLLLGIGMAIFQSPNSSALMGSVPRHRLGIASGMVATARNVGMVLGVSLAALMLAVREPGYLRALSATLAPEIAAKEAFLHAAHDAFWVAAALCVFGALASLVRGGPTVGAA
ncbi:MAG: DHA2 family efflux MFS transporter permease subunit [Thermoleophilia bacterium]